MKKILSVFVLSLLVLIFPASAVSLDELQNDTDNYVYFGENKSIDFYYSPNKITLVDVSENGDYYEINDFVYYVLDSGEIFEVYTTHYYDLSDFFIDEAEEPTISFRLEAVVTYDEDGNFIDEEVLNESIEVIGKEDRFHYELASDILFTVVE